MRQRPRQLMFMVIWMAVTSVVLAGCPKKPASGVGPGASMGAGTRVGAATGAGGSASDSSGTGAHTKGGGPGAASGLGATSGAGGAGPGGAGSVGATGTTISAFPSLREFVETSTLRDVHFDFDRYEIRAQDKPILEANARWLEANVNAFLLIEGHADERGTNEYNLALSEERAKIARDFLVSLGIEGSRITVIPYGKERPSCTEHTEACWAQNRRAHFLVRP